MDIEKSKASTTNVGSEAYPAARYFQIHFEFVREELQENRRIIEDLQKQLYELLIYLGNTDKTSNENIIQISRAKPMLTSVVSEKK
ncbi:hypothetical protein [Methylomonas sp. AM2-LC]|uniref:hypothetical protein n=1 Tax=Methylomonas sp. AM2-LC TaxID=3153301 RepID=UPI0032650511